MTSLTFDVDWMCLDYFSDFQWILTIDILFSFVIEIFY